MKIQILLAFALTMLFAVSGMCQTPDVNLIQPDMYGIPYLREALINADARYQAGGPGTTEEEIVKFHNHLVDILNLPDYARLDQKQVRFDRMILTNLHALGGLSPKAGEAQTEVTHKMSPLAAAILEDHLILNKRFNAGDQLAPGDWTPKKQAELSHLQTTDQIEHKDSGIDHTKDIEKGIRAKGSFTYAEANQLLAHLKETFKLSEIDVKIIKARALEGK